MDSQKLHLIYFDVLCSPWTMLLNTGARAGWERGQGLEGQKDLAAPSTACHQVTFDIVKDIVGVYMFVQR